jgi:hypothetical protein
MKGTINVLGQPISLKDVSMEMTIIENGADCYPWKPHFAWWPVKTITGLRAWGVKVYKRRVWVVWGTGFHMEPETQYATLFEILANDHNHSKK